jgi:hypothetical protein
VDLSPAISDAVDGAIVAGAVAGWLALRRRKRRLMYRLASVTPLVRIDRGGEKIVLLYDDVEVAQPYSCFFELENRGRSDITSDDFEERQAVGFHLGGVRVVGVSPEPGSEWLAEVIGTEPGAILVRPVLLPSRRRATLGLVTDGRPEVSWDGRPVLRNTQICTWRRRPW